MKRFGLSGAERQQGQRGITAAGPVRQEKREAGSDKQTGLACWRSERRRDTGKKRRRRRRKREWTRENLNV